MHTPLLCSTPLQVLYLISSSDSDCSLSLTRSDEAIAKATACLFPGCTPCCRDFASRGTGRGLLRVVWMSVLYLVRCRLFRWHTRIVYVESIARVESLSLSGRVLYHTRMADAFFVQWPHLQQNFPRSMYRGSLY